MIKKEEGIITSQEDLPVLRHMIDAITTKNKVTVREGVIIAKIKTDQHQDRIERYENFWHIFF